MRKTRRSFTPQQKAAILREHLVDRVAVSAGIALDREDGGLGGVRDQREGRRAALRALPGAIECP